jgi:tellurite methyltransferase
MQPRSGPRRGKGGLRIDLGANGLDDRLGAGSDRFLAKSIMALDDRARWDEKHAAEYATQKPSSFLKEIFETDSWPLPKGRALDIATGKGRNAIFLAEQGFQVVGIDISPVALEVARRTAQEKSLAIDWQEADLERIELPKGYYDLVVNFNYLQRSLVPQIKKTLKPGGWVIFETYLTDQSKIGHPINPDYLLFHNELLGFFRDFRVHYYREGKFLQLGEGEFRAGLLAQKGS